MVDGWQWGTREVRNVDLEDLTFFDRIPLRSTGKLTQMHVRLRMLFNSDHYYSIWWSIVMRHAIWGDHFCDLEGVRGMNLWVSIERNH